MNTEPAYPYEYFRTARFCFAVKSGRLDKGRLAQSLGPFGLNMSALAQEITKLVEPTSSRYLRRFVQVDIFQHAPRQSRYKITLLPPSTSQIVRAVAGVGSLTDVVQTTNLLEQCVREFCNTRGLPLDDSTVKTTRSNIRGSIRSYCKDQ